MSQKKVEDYKKAKVNRKEELKKEKRKSLIVKACVTVACIAVVGLIGFAFYYNAVKRTAGTDAHTVDLESVNQYLDELDMNAAMAEFSEDATGEAVSGNDTAQDNDATDAPAQTGQN